MKRMMALVLAMLMLLGAAQASGYDYTVPLWDAREDGDVFLGVAVSAGDGYYVTGGLDGFTLSHPYVLTPDGKVYASYLQTFTNGLALLTTSGKQSPAPISAKELGGVVQLVSYDEDGLRTLTGRVLYPITWREQTAYLLEAKSAVSMGTAVFDATQGLCGVIVAGWGEGLHRYVMLPVSAFGGLNGGEPAPTAPPAPTEPAAFSQWIEGAQASVEGHILTVTWTEDMLQSAQEDSIVAVYIADTANSYYSWSYAKAAEGSLILPVAPGRTYEYAVQHAYGEPVRDGQWRNHAATMTVDKARPYNRYGYKDTEIYIGTVPATDEAFTTQKADRPEKITRALLEDERLSVILQVTSKYRVRREDTCDLLITLTVPDGSMFLEPASFIFMPDLADGDVWNSNLDPMLDDYLTLNKTYDAGEYRVDYYFDGTIVNSVVFTID